MEVCECGNTQLGDTMKVCDECPDDKKKRKCSKCIEECPYDFCGFRGNNVESTPPKNLCKERFLHCHGCKKPYGCKDHLTWCDGCKHGFCFEGSQCQMEEYGDFTGGWWCQSCGR